MGLQLIDQVEEPTDDRRRRVVTAGIWAPDDVREKCLAGGLSREKPRDGNLERFAC
jgi:hypothetical protein